jgi:2-polyprenyl-6-methoxyphenol hydroxylase-like FAD-dependent oxidoreductase
VLNCLCAQDDLEPVLRRFAERQPVAELRFNAELASVEQDARGVTAIFSDRIGGGEIKVRAAYLIGADGAKSRTRRLVAREMIGREGVYDSVNIVFRADLRPWTQHRPAALYFVEQTDLRATFLTINAHDRWGFLIHSLKQYGYTPADFTEMRCAELIRQGVGRSDLPVEVLGISAWEASAVVADRYRNGRLFLAGDAAHEMPPTGGFGLNTGVQDVQNLVWKLAAVLKGQAGEPLLDTYQAERLPVATMTTKASLENSLSMGRTARQDGAKLPRSEFLNEQGLIFGQSYDSGAVVPDGTPPPAIDDPVTRYLPSARPGGRAPHLWFELGGERLSTIDLFGHGFVLLAGAEGAAWARAASRLAAAGRPALAAHVVGGSGDLGDADETWRAAYGVEPSGAVLVRPDGYVGWRSRDGADDPARVLAEALDRILSRR